MPETWRAAVLIAGNDLRRRVRDRSLLIQGVIAPVLLGLIVGVSFGGGPSLDATIGVVDTSRLPAGAAVVAALTSDVDDEASLRFVEVVGDPAEAVASEELDAAIVLRSAAGSDLSLTVYGRPGATLSQSVAESVASSVAARLHTGALAAAATARVRQASPQEAARIAEAAAGLTPAVVVGTEGLRSDFSIIGYFAPAMAMLFLFFTLGSGARSVIGERREGTLSRIRAAPVSDDAVLLGKTLGVLVLGLLSLTTVWAVTALGFGVDWGDPLGVALVLTSVVLAIAGISLLLTGLARTENQADALTTIVALALSVVGGSFFFGAGGAVATLKPFTPNGRALTALTELSAGEATALQVLPSVLALATVGLVTGAVGVVALRRKVAA